MITVLDGKRIDLGTLRFGVVDDAGVQWLVDTLQGWDSAEVRSTVTQREAAHGSWMSPSYLGERIITLSGTLAAPTGALLDAAVEQLLAAAPLSGFATLTVYEAIPKQVSVRQSGKPIIQPIGDRLATWSLLVTAPDPRRYGTSLRSATSGLPATSGGLVLPAAPPWTLSAVTTSGFIGMTNEGSLTAYPTLAIAGPVQHPTVTVRYAGGVTAALAYASDLAAGDVLTLDCQEHTAVVGGASRRRYVSGTWPEIPPGGADLLFGSSVYSSTATLTATWRPAWR